MTSASSRADAPILVTGANGFVGQAVAAHLAGQGWTVSGTVRNASSHLPAGIARYVTGAIDGSTDWRALLSGMHTVVHLAARAHVLRDDAIDPLATFRLANRDATLRLARQASDAGVGRFIFVSSIGVNGNATDGRPFQALDDPAPGSPYAVAKLEAEEELRSLATASAMDIVIIRPPLVIGPRAPGNIGLLLRAIRRGVPLPLGAVTRNRRDFVSVDTLAGLIAVVVGHRNAIGVEPLLVSDGASISTCELALQLGTMVGRRARLLAVPPVLLRVGLALAGRGAAARQLLDDLEVDISRTRSRLGWTPLVVGSSA